MNDRLLNLYHALPGPFRSLAASLRGYYLHSWRYGRETDRLVAEALERESWSPNQWQTWQQQRLEHILTRAVTRVPYYRNYWTDRRRRGESVNWEDLSSWPILEKETVRAQPRAFLADDCDPRRLWHEHTSGTTGKSLDLWFNRSTNHHWYALCEARWRQWYHVSRHDRWAILGGQLVTPVRQSRPPFWVWNAAMHQLYLSAYHLAPDFVPYYLDALKRYRIKYLWGYTSALHALAQEAHRLGRTDLPMVVAITNAEPVADYQRQEISAAFQCPVRETYGMSEMVAAASECEQGRLHVWPEAGLLELYDNDGPVTNHGTGDLLCTGLLNPDMPLIRYRVGDRVSGPLEFTPCACGRSLPTIQGIEGRTDDVLFTADGRRIGRLDPVFKSNLPVREAQIIQETLHHLRVRYVPAPGFNPSAARSIVERLQSRFGPVEVILEAVPQVPRTANGKFRAVICNLPAHQKTDLLKPKPSSCH